MRNIFVINILITLSLILTIPYLAYSQSWGTVEKKGGDSWFDSGNKTQVIVNEDRKPESKNSLSTTESTWNLDLEGLAYIMPDQPAPDQMVTSFTGFGTTYKFSDVLHIAGKWMQFDLQSSDGVTWHHEHMLAGLGARGFFGEGQQWQINLLSGESSVKGNQGIGEVKNLEIPVFLDIKYMWVMGDIMAGPQITFGRVANSCKDPDGTYTECGHGGYTSISLTFQIGLPDSWGN